MSGHVKEGDMVRSAESPILGRPCGGGFNPVRAFYDAGTMKVLCTLCPLPGEVTCVEVMLEGERVVVAEKDLILCAVDDSIAKTTKDHGDDGRPTSITYHGTVCGLRAPFGADDVTVSVRLNRDDALEFSLTVPLADAPQLGDVVKVTIK